MVATVTLDVKSVNDFPVVDSFMTVTHPNTPVAVTLRGSDADGDLLTFSTVVGPSNGRLTGTSPQLHYEPDPGFLGTDSFTYHAFDGSAHSVTAQVAITVRDPTPTTVSFRDGIDGYRGTRDTRIRGDAPTANYGTSSKLELDGKPDQVSLIRWDISIIPPGSIVTEVALTFQVITTSLDHYEVYESRRPWDENIATYELAAAGQPWDRPGSAGEGDRGSTVLASLTGPTLGSKTVLMNADGVAAVQNWVNDAGSNFGIVIQDLYDGTTDDLDVSSREQTRFGPMLTIKYYRAGASANAAAVRGVRPAAPRFIPPQELAFSTLAFHRSSASRISIQTPAMFPRNAWVPVNRESGGEDQAGHRSKPAAQGSRRTGSVQPRLLPDGSAFMAECLLRSPGMVESIQRIAEERVGIRCHAALESKAVTSTSVSQADPARVLRPR